MDWIKQIRPLAVIVGVVVDIVLTMVLVCTVGVVITFIFMAKNPGMSPDQLNYEMKESLLYFVFFMALGGLCTVLGGFITAHMARGAEMANGMANGVLTIFAGGLLNLAVTSLIPESGAPAWQTAVGIILTIPSAVVGAYLRKISREPEAAQPGQWGQPYPGAPGQYYQPPYQGGPGQPYPPVQPYPGGPGQPYPGGPVHPPPQQAPPVGPGKAYPWGANVPPAQPGAPPQHPPSPPAQPPAGPGTKDPGDDGSSEGGAG